MSTYMQVEVAKRAHVKQLFECHGVVGVGVGYAECNGMKTGQLAVIVSVVEKLPEVMLPWGAVVPREVGGVPTDVQEVGQIKALQARTDRWRPAPGGVSIGHYNVTAGTLGCIVEKGGELYILSNNHVLADCNRGAQGDAILQPGQHDGGTVEHDTIAELADYVPVSIIGSSECPVAEAVAAGANLLARVFAARSRLRPISEPMAMNLVDAAIAKPLSEEMVDRTILEIGHPFRAIEAQLGMKVRKSGRTTGLNEGEVTQLDVTITVAYPPQGVAVFTDQIMTTPVAEGGDSGSLAVNEDNRAVALVFGGSAQATVCNRIQHVENLLEVRVG